MRSYIALMRGINVAGRHKLPMRDLVELFEEAGCTNVRTYIQSGNVLFSADEELAARLPETIMASIAQRFGHDVPVVLRDARRLAEIVADNPFAGAQIDDKELHVVFLAAEPDAESVAALDPERSPPDEFDVRGAEIYLRLPNGMARTKLNNAYFDRVLGTISTMRNWRTTRKLLELSGE